MITLASRNQRASAGLAEVTSDVYCVTTSDKRFAKRKRTTIIFYNIFRLK
jgi:hypothetical protein